MDEFEEYYKNSEWFGTYQSDLMMKEAFEAGQQSMQAKVCSLEEHVEELQEEFAEDERFLKEQIKDKDLKISNLEYQQGMDKELIQSLQSKIKKLQKRVDTVVCELDCQIQCSVSSHTQKMLMEIRQALNGEGQ